MKCLVHLKFNVATQCECTNGSFYSQNGLIILILDGKTWIAQWPFLFNSSNNIARWGRHFHRLKATREPTGGASQRAIQMNHLIFVNVHNFHIKWPSRTTAIPCATIIFLDSPINLIRKRNDILNKRRVFFPLNHYRWLILAFWPKLFFIVNLLFVSNPVNASRSSTFCLTNSWSIVVRYSKPGGQFGIPRGIFIQPSAKRNSIQKEKKN